VGVAISSTPALPILTVTAASGLYYHPKQPRVFAPYTQKIVRPPRTIVKRRAEKQSNVLIFLFLSFL
jgi:hypothetical protein